MKLTEAIDKIVKQTGNPIKLENADAMASVEIELDAEDAPLGGDDENNATSELASQRVWDNRERIGIRL